jgi:extracellular factor (EF) 3-hydroxypalmitic acid methyl ester biosynthesis protein
MDQALIDIERGNISCGMARLAGRLNTVRRGLARHDWLQFIEDRVRPHRVREVVHLDPLTKRAFSRPRGYAGDAVMMDYIYGRPPAELLHSPEVARRLYSYCTTTGAPTAVRYRRQLLADTIDGEAAKAGRAIDVVAVAAGHLREADLSLAIHHGQAAVTALDQDEESLDVITRDYAGYAVEAVPASVRHIITGRTTLPESDLCYSAGLYDYLPESAATRLTEVMFASLRPGGTLLIANFLPEISDAGYMESLMDWHLIYRTDAEMAQLMQTVPVGDIASVDLFHDPFDNITFLRATKIQ